MSRSSFLAPPAPWMLDEEDEYLYQQTLSAAADLLRKHLERRIALLAEDGIDEVLLEIRKQMAECAVEGDITRSGDLGDLVMDIVASKAHARRL